MEETNDLHVFRVGEEYVVAYDAEDALQVLRETGADPEDLASEDDPVQRLPDEQTLTVAEEEPETIQVTKTCREWCDVTGRGYLAGESF